MSTIKYTPEQIRSWKPGQSSVVGSRLVTAALKNPDLRDVVKLARQPQATCAAPLSLGLHISSPNIPSNLAGSGHAKSAVPSNNPMPVEQLPGNNVAVGSHENTIPSQPPQPRINNDDRIPKLTNLPEKEVEGFRRFYKAVASPTHVRVTAAGNIVPNTGAPSSPTSKPVPGTPAMPTANGTTADAGKPIALPAPLPVPVTVPVQSQPIAAFPMVSPAPAPVLAPMKTQLGLLPTEHGWLSVPIAIAPYRYSPVSMYPQQAVPLQVPVPPAMAAPSATPGFGGYPPRPGCQIPLHSNHTSSGTQAGGCYPASMMSTLSSALNLTKANSVCPPTSFPNSSIKASEITRRHIERMKEVLKYNNDQLQLNRHQVDERALERQNVEIMNLIASFQQTYKLQLEAEAKFATSPHKSVLPKNRPVNNVNVSLDTKIDGPRSTSDGVLMNNSGNLPAWTSLPQPFRQSTAETVVPRIVPVPLPVQKQEPEHRQELPTLPVNAVTAPPFQPRQQQDAARPAISSSRVIETVKPDTGAGDLKLGTPYLRGHAPLGDSKGGFIYSRDLTEDEKESRRLYWGNASSSARKGLPKFDGRNFYPPSPGMEQQNVTGFIPLTGQPIQSASKTNAHASGNVGSVEPFNQNVKPVASTLGAKKQQQESSETSGASSNTKMTAPTATNAVADFLRSMIRRGVGSTTAPAISPPVTKEMTPKSDGQKSYSQDSSSNRRLMPSPASTIEDGWVDLGDEFPDAESRLRDLLDVIALDD